MCLGVCGHTCTRISTARDTQSSMQLYAYALASLVSRDLSSPVSTTPPHRPSAPHEQARPHACLPALCQCHLPQSQRLRALHHHCSTVALTGQLWRVGALVGLCVVNTLSSTQVYGQSMMLRVQVDTTSSCQHMQVTAPRERTRKKQNVPRCVGWHRGRARRRAGRCVPCHRPTQSRWQMSSRQRNETSRYADKTVHPAPCTCMMRRRIAMRA